MTPDQARWCSARVADGTLIIDGDDLRVTDAGWDLILTHGAAGTDLEGATLDRAFVLGAAMGAGEVSVLYDTIGLLEAILLAVDLGLDPAPVTGPVGRPTATVVTTVDHTADPADDTPLQAAVRALMEGDLE